MGIQLVAGTVYKCKTTLGGVKTRAENLKPTLEITGGSIVLYGSNKATRPASVDATEMTKANDLLPGIRTIEGGTTYIGFTGSGATVWSENVVSDIEDDR